MLLFFCFVMKRQIMNITCYYKKICKNTFFLYLFSLLWWKTVYFWLVTALSFTQHFFPSGGFHAQGVDAHPINIFGFPLKFWKNGWWCYHREGFECKNQKYFIKKTKLSTLGRCGLMSPFLITIGRIRKNKFSFLKKLHFFWYLSKA